MSRKRKKSVPTAPPKREKKMVIDMMKVERAKANHSVGFRTGRHLTEKDRPRKKDWKREYERGKGSGASYKDFTGPFSLQLNYSRFPQQLACFYGIMVSILKCLRYELQNNRICNGGGKHEDI